MPTCPHCSRSYREADSACPDCPASLSADFDQNATDTASPAQMWDPLASFELGPNSTVPAKPSASSARGQDILDLRFEPGTLLAERYRVVNAVGRGGMGEVYRADDLELGGAVALKFLPAEIERDPKRLEMLLGEARIARNVSHPNVCRVHDIGIHRDAERDLYFVSMEYIDGEDLSSLLRRIGRLPKPKALDVARQLCAGLAAVHGCGLLHRDIKPGNVMLDGRGKVRLADFGLAINGSEAETRVGTPAYMAPEQHTHKIATVRSDIYALGLVLYEIFTGQQAFSAKSQQEYAWRHLQFRPDTPSMLVEDLHPVIERVILACLEKVPERRLPSAEAVADALANVQDIVAGSPRPSIEQGEVLRALLVCDWVDSTALVETLGDRRAAELGTRHDRLARDLLVRHQGREIDKTDGFLLLFEQPVQALCFALDYHDTLEKLSIEKSCSLEARVGIHFDHLWLRENPSADVLRGAKPVEVDGLAKAVVARLMDLAEGRQTLLSNAAFDLARRAAVGLGGAEDLRWLDHGAWRLHGVADPVDIYEVGREGKAPLRAPSESNKVRRLLMQPRVDGWRPAPGLSVPKRPHWQVERRLGEGGFGEAWLVRHVKTGEPRCFKFCFDAERLRALQREITLFRLLKEELGERRDINRLLDWNLGEAPYFIESEYTQIGDLVQWADGAGGLQKVPLATRLEIVAQVASALAAAHSVGVLHKDVKPSNVLIQEAPDGSVQAQLADFGIGQVTETERLSAAGITVLGLTRRTAAEVSSGQVGTPLYLAPELLEGRTPTLQADIYSLGVLLYQMVVGDFRRALAQGWRREIEDTLLASDIATFIDGTPERRPADAAEVAQRLRTLDHRRQEHRAAEATRQALEAAQRRRTVYKTVATAALVVLLAVSVLAVWALHAGREERRARETTERVLDFMVGVFEGTDPYGTRRPRETRGQTITAREILDRGAERFETEFADEPLVRARLMGTYGEIYRSLGLYDKALTFHEQALDTQRQRLGTQDLDTLRAQYGLGKTLVSVGDYARARALLEDALEIQQRDLGDDHPDTLATMEHLGTSLYGLGQFDAARDLFQQTLEVRTQQLGPEHPDTLASMIGLANSLESLGSFTAGKRLFEQTLDIQRRVLGNEHPQTLLTMGNLAASLLRLGEYVEGKELVRQTLDIETRVLGGEHPQTLLTMGNLAASHLRLGEYGEGRRLLEKILEIQTPVLGIEHPQNLLMMGNLAYCLTGQGESGQALQLLDTFLEQQIDALGADHEQTLFSLYARATALSQEGQLEEAERQQQRVLDTVQASFGEERWLALRSMASLGDIVARRGDGPRSRQILEDALDLHQRVLRSAQPETQEVKIHLASVLHKLDETERARSLARSAHNHLDATFGPRHELTTQASQRLLEIALLEEDMDSARHWIESMAWLVDSDERSLQSAKQRATRRYVLQAMEKLTDETAGR